MKAIQPVTIWVNGENKQGVWLNAYIINDNLSDSATFYWNILNVTELQLAQGNLTISGQSYIDWNANPDINDDAYLWISLQLGLTLI
jgi:hypothetical protein